MAPATASCERDWPTGKSGAAPLPATTLRRPPAADTRRVWAICLGLLSAVALIYGQTLGHGFLAYDDDVFVAANPVVAAGVTARGVRWAFTDGPWGEWYPLAMLSHMLDCQLFGLSPWGHHLTNVLLHAAASIGLFLVLRRMTGDLWPSALVAALFAVHPQHVESVAWVAERRDVLSGLLFVLTLAAYLGYVRAGRPAGRYLLTLVLLALGLMAKPMLVTLPALLLLVDYWPLGRYGSAGTASAPLARPGLARLMLEKLPLAALAAAVCVMTLRTHTSAGASPEWPARIGQAVVSGGAYLAAFCYPANLATFYPTTPADQPPGKWPARSCCSWPSARRRCPGGGASRAFSSVGSGTWACSFRCWGW